jgi:hypothetical protein
MSDAPSHFLSTNHYRRFVEFGEYCRDKKYIGLCYGKPGVGKTESARQFANWNLIEPLLQKSPRVRQLPESLAHCDVLFLTPEVTVTPKKLETSINLSRNRFDGLIEQARVSHFPESFMEKRQSKNVKLLIVDEADRLKFQSLELLRDLHDRGNLGIVLMGMPGIERRIKRFGQLYSRVHLTYEYPPLNADETALFIAQKWSQLDLPRSADDSVSAAIKRVCNGNFRVLNRIFTEIERLQKLNCLPLITPDLVETARQGLLLGSA